jgi:GDP-mannose 6-dehydrogenase
MKFSLRRHTIISASARRRVGILGLSFKPGTDDLRESSLVELVQRLYGRGNNVRVFDPNIQLSKLSGTNLKYVRSRLAHMGSLLCSSLEKVLDHADVIVIGNAVLGREALPLIGDKTVIDLVRVDRARVSGGVYQRLCW